MDDCWQAENWLHIKKMLISHDLIHDKLPMTHNDHGNLFIKLNYTTKQNFSSIGSEV